MTSEREGFVAQAVAHFVRVFLIIGLLAFVQPIVAQEPLTDWEEQLQQMVEDDEANDEQDLEAKIELLNELHEHPININLADRSLLLSLPFLSERSIDAILDYLTKNGPMRTLGELRLVDGLSFQENQWLRHFVYVGEASAQLSRRDTTWWGRDRHEAVLRTDIPLYQRAGWPWRRGVAQRLRYTWQQGWHLDAGLWADNDAGEPCFNRDNPLWDSYGGHIMLRDIGPLRTLIVGDFKVGFGEGLVVNNSLRLGKSGSSMWRTSNLLRPHRSADEVNFLRGVAAAVHLGREWDITAFYSRRNLDATVNDDNTVSTLSTTGLHRTAGELAHKATVGAQTTGLHIGSSYHVRHVGGNVGATALYQYYDHQLVRGAALYRQIYPEGYQFGAASVNYSLQAFPLMFSGETAHSFAHQGGGWSTLNKASWRISSNTQLSAIHRFYSKHYFSPYASAFGENSRVQNESGLAFLLEADQLGPIALRWFVDYFYSPWPRYTMTRSSRGWETDVQTTYMIRRGRTLLLRYAVKSKERSDQRYVSHRLRTTYTHVFTPHWTGVVAAFVHRFHEMGNSTGYALAPRIDYASDAQRLRLSVMAVLFRTDDFDSRLFLYEPSLFQSFGLQQLYGRGQRLATTLRLHTPNRRWTFQTKLGVTHYSDRSEISSGFLRISSPWKADLHLLLRLHM